MHKLPSFLKSLLSSSVDPETKRRAYFEALSPVPEAVSRIRQLTDDQCCDLNFLENTLIPQLGLNNENLSEQPHELAPFFGKNLHLWQYPIQLAPYLLWLKEQAPAIKHYIEIGCRWGGTFILISEWLKRNGAPLESMIAIDPIDPSPLLVAYASFLKNEGGPSMQYLQALSTEPAARELLKKYGTDLVFIDGDHSLKGALKDHLQVRDRAQWIVHHDISSEACPDTTFLWEALKTFETTTFDAQEFIAQYPSVTGRFLDIGVLKRK